MLSVVRRVINGIAGIGLGTLGIVALTRAGGLGFDRHVDAFGYHHTGLLAWVELFVAIFFVLAAISGASGGETMFLGLVVLGFGVVVLVTGNDLHGFLGVHEDRALIYVVPGGLVTLLGLATLGEKPPARRPMPGRR